MSWPLALILVVAAGFALYRLARRTGVRDATDAVTKQTKAEVIDLKKRAAAARGVARKSRNDWL